MAKNTGQTGWRLFIGIMQIIIAGLIMKGINDVGDVRERVARIEGQLEAARLLRSENLTPLAAQPKVGEE